MRSYGAGVCGSDNGIPACFGNTGNKGNRRSEIPLGKDMEADSGGRTVRNTSVHTFLGSRNNRRSYHRRTDRTYVCDIHFKFAPPKFGAAVRTAVELLSGIPSVVYGLVGMIIIVPAVRKAFSLPDGANLFSAILVLAVMILPSVISVSETAIKAVPKEYEEGSLALGATKTETVFKVVVPAAKSGILTAVVLGIGRAIGEAMAVMMVSGNTANMPKLFGSVRFLTTAVASEMSYSSGLQRKALFSIALVLFIFILIINLVLNMVIKKEKEVSGLKKISRRRMIKDGAINVLMYLAAGIIILLLAFLIGYILFADCRTSHGAF